MTDGHVDTLTRAVSALNAGDVERWLEAFHPDAEWVSTPRWAALDSPRYSGHEELRGFIATQFESFPDLRYEIDAMACAGSQVLTKARWSGTGLLSGLELDLVIFHAFGFEGDRIRRVQGFEDEEQARATTEIAVPWRAVNRS